MEGSPRSIWWPLVLVLGASFGLLAVGSFSLWKAATGAQDAARSEATRGALLTARSMGRAFRDPTILSALPHATRFRISSGTLEISEELAWIREPPRTPSSLTLPWPLRQTLSRIRSKAEDRDPEASRREERDLFARADEFGIDPASLAHLQLGSAWRSHRRGDSETRDENLARIGGQLNHLTPATLVGWVLLKSEVLGAPPDGLTPALRRLPRDRGMALLERLEERFGTRVSKEQLANLRAVVEKAGRRRALLHEVHDLLPNLRNAVAPVIQKGLHDRILVYFPTPETGSAGAPSGAGALATGEEFVRAWEQQVDLRSSGAPGILSGGRVVFSDAPPQEGLPVLPGLSVVPSFSSPGSSSLGLSVLGLLLASLMAFLGFGLVLVSRAIRKERLAMSARTDFLTAVTHEIKTPVTSLRLLSEMLVDDRALTEQKRREYARNLASEAGRLEVLVENVLDLGRSERGERSYDRRRQELSPILEEVRDLMDPILTRDGMELILHDETRGLVEVDRQALTQAILNLLENARRYAAEGKIVELFATHHPDGLVGFEVRDQGPGVKITERESIFEKFNRGSRAREGGNPGVGLGLYLARSIFRAHGGDLWLEASEAGSGSPGKEGTRFVATLKESGESEPAQPEKGDS